MSRQRRRKTAAADAVEALTLDADLEALWPGKTAAGRRMLELLQRARDRERRTPSTPRLGAVDLDPLET